MSKLGKFAAAFAALVLSVSAFGAETVVWVNAAATPAEPYDTAESGFVNLIDAVNYQKALETDDAKVIKVKNGTYADSGITLDFPVRIEGVCDEGTTASFNHSSAQVLTLNDDDVVVTGLKFSGTGNNSKVTINKGTVSDCVFTGGANVGSGCVFVQKGGLTTDCLFTGNKGFGGYGGCTVNMTDGVMSNCVFRGERQMETVVWLKGGLFIDSVITNCNALAETGHGNLGNNAMVINGATARAERILVWKNGSTTHTYKGNGWGSIPGGVTPGIVTVMTGALVNSLVYGNSAKDYPGVSVFAGGRVVNCTIGPCAGKGLSAANGIDMLQSGGEIVNTIIYGEVKAGDNGYAKSGGKVTHSIFANAAHDDGQSGNLVKDPRFTDADAGNLVPYKTSPCRNAGVADAAMADVPFDFAGDDRVQDGVIDIGCYELKPFGPEDLEVQIEKESASLDDDHKATLTLKALLIGGATDGFSYSWTEDDTVIGSSDTLTKTFAPGFHRVTVTCTKEAVVKTDSYEFTVYPKTMFVNAESATPEAPYDSPATAATSLRDAFDFIESSIAVLGQQDGDAAVSVVKVADGTYALNNLMLNLPVQLVAQEGASPVLDLGKVDPGISFNDSRQVLDGFTVINGRTHALRFYSGSCMRNCLVVSLENVIGGTSEPFILVSGATVSNCVFRGAQSTAHAYADPVLSLTGAARVSDCLFENITKLDSIVWISNANAVMSNCEFRNCPLESQGGSNPRYNVLYLTAGLVSHCVITNCGSTSATGRGDKPVGGIVAVEGANATLRNCLIANCSAKENAGIDIANGAVENCTVVGGTLAESASGSQRNLKQTGGRVVNSIFWNTLEVDGVTLSGGTFEYSTSILKKSGETNIGGDPGLDVNFVPTSGSKVRDKGTSLAWITEDAVDLRGSNRVVNAIVDIGAFEGDELAAQLLLSLSETIARLDGEQVVYAVTPDAKVGYDPVANPEFSWTVDGEPAGSSSGMKEFALLPRSTPYVIGCTVSADGQETSAELKLTVHSGVFYVSPDGSGEAPYASWETAAKSLDVVLAIPHPTTDTRVYTVHIAAGNYATGAFNLVSPTALVGEDGAVFTSGEAATLSHPDSSISNLVFSGRGFSMSRGTARDIVVRNRSGQSSGTLVTLGGGICEGLVMTNCRTTAWAYQYGISVSGSARLSNFLIENCAGYDALLTAKGQAVVSNGTIKSSNGVLGGGQGNTHEYLISAEGGVVSHVLVTDCGDKRDKSSWSSRDGTVRVAGGTVRNSLIVGNRSTDCAGVKLESGHLESCTVIVNDGDVLHKTGYGTYGSCLNMTGGFATNCVFYTTEAASDDWNYCRVTGGKIGNCWLSVKGKDSTPVGEVVLVGDDPCFKSVNGWDFVPAGGSPLLGKGRNQPWMTGATDLAGRKRVCGRHVDIGAFEGDASGFVLIMR